MEKGAKAAKKTGCLSWPASRPFAPLSVFARNSLLCPHGDRLKPGHRTGNPRSVALTLPAIAINFGFMFELVSSYQPAGDQPQAIAKLTEGLLSGAKHQALLGVTGSGKTFSVANVIRNVNRPTLVISHNKTLAAQLYAEFKGFFPNNAVEYFVSYFDYYQPEAYIPRTDTFVEKDSSINEETERMRLSTMSSLFTRRDVVVVASVSCIYGIGSKEDYEALIILSAPDSKSLVNNFSTGSWIYNTRATTSNSRGPGKPRVRGDTVELCPAGREDALRIEFFGEEIERITR